MNPQSKISRYNPQEKGSKPDAPACSGCNFAAESGGTGLYLLISPLTAVMMSAGRTKVLVLGDSDNLRIPSM